MGEENKEISEKRQLINQGAVSVAIEKILETDRVAQQILDKAYAHAKEIEEKTEQEKKEVEKKCEQEFVDMKTKVDEQLLQHYNEHKKKLDDDILLKENNLKDTFNKNEQKWANDIYHSIIHAE